MPRAKGLGLTETVEEVSGGSEKDVGREAKELRGGMALRTE